MSYVRSVEKSISADKNTIKKAENILLYVNRIKSILPKNEGEYISSNFVLKTSVERYLQLISDEQVNILFLLYKGTLRVHGDYTALLKASTQFSQDLRKKMAKRRKLRNILVHRYLEGENDKTIFDQASNLEDVKEFVKQVISFARKKTLLRN